jgi:membrane fusion protein (multidrug efflux system)
VTTVAQEDVPVHTEWVATTDGYVNATIRAQVQGYLLKQEYQEGDLVKQGQLLFSIDDRPFAAALNQAQAALKQAEAALLQAQAEIKRNEAQLYIAQTDLARIKPLAEENAISKKDLDDAIGAERSTRAAVVAAQAAAVAAQAAVGSAEATVERARLELGFTKIASPIDGIAGIARAQVGDLLGPAQNAELATVSTVNPIKVYFTASEQDYIAYVHKHPSGAPTDEESNRAGYELVLGDGTVYGQKGSFFAIDRQVDPRTGTIRMAATFPNPDNLLRPGQFGKVRTTEVLKGALLVPQRAVTEFQGKFQVAVVGSDKTVDLRPVTTGDRIAERWIITAGLTAGEQIVTEGAAKVKQSMTVNPVPVQQSAAASPAASSGGK